MKHSYIYISRLKEAGKLSCKKLHLFVIGISFVCSQTSCSKLIEVNPPVTSINSENVFTSAETAASMLTGIYVSISGKDFNGGGTVASISLFAGLSADELTLFDFNSNSKVAYYRNALSASPAVGHEFWNNLYPIIFICNSVIESVSSSDGLTTDISQSLIGEAKFIRAFCYFYLVNLYGDVPLALGTDYTVNTILTRTAKEVVYTQIINDLRDAQASLTSDYLDGNLKTYPNISKVERVRPNKWAATALLSRVYLYTKDYKNAEDQATTIINNTLLYNLTDLKSVFKKNSNEAIWQLQPVISGQNTQDARIFILPTTGPSSTYPVYLDTSLINVFDSIDLRKQTWIKNISVGGKIYYYPYKYQIGTVSSQVLEYPTVLRLAEQYLIRAEARAQLDNLNGSLVDLNKIRGRSGLSDTVINNKNSLLNTVFQERQREYFTEWGHRWFDIKRMGIVDSVMTKAAPKKGGIWNSSWQWYPIPLTEIQRNPNLSQNKDY